MMVRRRQCWRQSLPSCRDATPTWASRLRYYLFVYGIRSFIIVDDISFDKFIDDITIAGQREAPQVELLPLETGHCCFRSRRTSPQKGLQTQRKYGNANPKRIYTPIQNRIQHCSRTCTSTVSGDDGLRQSYGYVASGMDERVLLQNASSRFGHRSHT